MQYTLVNDLIASVLRDASTSANIISGLFSRRHNVILEKDKADEANLDAAQPKKKNDMTAEK